MQNVRDKVAFITGGANEAGIQIASALGAAGVTIALADDDEDRLAAARSLLLERRIDAWVLRTDVSDRADMRKAAEAVVAHFGKVHILIANAERSSTACLHDTDDQEWDRTVAVNLGGVVNMIQEFLPTLRRQNEGGHILARVPLAGVVTGVSPGARAVQSSSVVAIMEAFSAELRDQGIGSSLIIDPVASHEDSGNGSEIGSRVLNGILADDLYIFADDVPADTIRHYFEPLLAAMPSEAPSGAPQGGRDPEAMFPVYAAVLRAKEVRYA